MQGRIREAGLRNSGERNFSAGLWVPTPPAISHSIIILQNAESICNSASGVERYVHISVVTVELISSIVLLIAYFTQFTVVPIIMMKDETEGIALLTQYNGHGIFIALEELGYITMSISFLFLAPVFSTKKRLEKSIRLTLIMPFLITILSFVLYSIKYGIDRDYRFEVATITINWLVTITVGILISIFIQRRMKSMI